MRNFIFFLLFLSYCDDSLQQASYDTSTLQLVSVVFRHGERTPDDYCQSLNKNASDTYWPDGFGALTLVGKQQEYNIGVALRQKYGSWLGNTLTPDILEARTTDTPRTKMSLQLLQAGLWPPSYDQTWNWELNWQSVPFIYEKMPSDTLLGYPLYCGNFYKEYTRILNTTEVKNMLRPTNRLTEYVAKNNFSMLPTRPIENAYALYSCLLTLENMNRTLPNWTKLIYPTAVAKAAYKEYVLKTYNDMLMKLTAGQLIKKFLDDSQNKIMGKLVPQGRKLFLYSGHEFNIAHLLRALNNYYPHFPSYGSYVAVELHNINQTYGFKIFHQDYKTVDPILLTIPGCGEFCSLEDFKKLLFNRIPGPEIVC